MIWYVLRRLSSIPPSSQPCTKHPAQYLAAAMHKHKSKHTSQPARTPSRTSALSYLVPLSSHNAQTLQATRPDSSSGRLRGGCGLAADELHPGSHRSSHFTPAHLHADHTHTPIDFPFPSSTPNQTFRTAIKLTYPTLHSGFCKPPPIPPLPGWPSQRHIQQLHPTLQTFEILTNLQGSREQNYRPEDCSICHAGLVGKKGHGFWEGGKGTRDRTRMSRKDPRKFKRLPGGQARKMAN